MTLYDIAQDFLQTYSILLLHFSKFNLAHYVNTTIKLNVISLSKAATQAL